VQVTVTYTLTEGNELITEMTATTGKRWTFALRVGGLTIPRVDKVLQFLRYQPM
jgi:hypothetical protein